MLQIIKKYIDTFIGNSEQPNVLSRLALPTVVDSEELSGRYQGDIVLDDEDYERMLTEYTMGRNAYTTSTTTTWPNNVVVYEFATNAFSECPYCIFFLAVFSLFVLSSVLLIY